MTYTLSELSAKQLKRATKIKVKIETLQAQLNQVLGAENGAGISKLSGRGRKMSAAARAAIAASARKRWARARGETPEESSGKGRRKMSAAGKAALSASARARWKAAKAAGKMRL